MKESQEIFAKTQNFPNRKFKLLKKITESTEETTFIGLANFWGNKSNKEFILKIQPQSQVSKQQQDELSKLVSYQSSSILENQYPSNIIQVFDVFEQNQQLITVIERGEIDLTNYLMQNREQITIKEKLQICLDATLSIQFLHSQNLISNGIKSQNYQKVEGKFKLVDFGSFNNNVSILKQQKQGIAAPELFEANCDFTDKVDIWGLGCLFYEILNDSTLFHAQKDNEIGEKKNISQNIQKVIEVKLSQQSVTPQMKQLMMNMLNPNYKQRFSIKEVVSELLQIVNPNQAISTNKELKIGQLKNNSNSNLQILNQQVITNENDKQQKIELNLKDYIDSAILPIKEEYHKLLLEQKEQISFLQKKIENNEKVQTQNNLSLKQHIDKEIKDFDQSLIMKVEDNVKKQLTNNLKPTQNSDENFSQFENRFNEIQIKLNNQIEAQKQQINSQFLNIQQEILQQQVEQNPEKSQYQLNQQIDYSMKEIQGVKQLLEQFQFAQQQQFDQLNEKLKMISIQQTTFQQYILKNEIQQNSNVDEQDKQNLNQHLENENALFLEGIQSNRQEINELIKTKNSLKFEVDSLLQEKKKIEQQQLQILMKKLVDELGKYQPEERALLVQNNFEVFEKLEALMNGHD